MKTCSKCSTEKPLSDFNKSSKGKFGVRGECKDCQSILTKERHKRLYTPEKGREKNLRNVSKISLEGYNNLFEKQEGCCAICKRHQSEFKKTFSVDHSHITGNIRGLLCSQCNTAIGLMYDDIFRLYSAIEYLNKNRANKKKP